MIIDKLSWAKVQWVLLLCDLLCNVALIKQKKRRPVLKEWTSRMKTHGVEL